ncbi:MAG: hypothetical protein AYP45_03830 [Candidatus Brocadia carolinensis]|uniref:Uncharacterized protein n=1 Tax=Candidatus Brocadia carolinensis TaxID=1004156 RepID=A0A1V4AW02_9BACT|nr:MAG: hypothetical protein AYP45_03830 [Candidatus Brocadia caroliniensis]
MQRKEQGEVNFIVATICDEMMKDRTLRKILIQYISKFSYSCQQLEENKLLETKAKTGYTK